MHFFNYKGNKLYAEGVPIERIVKKVGTPCYVYSKKTLVRHYHAFDDAFRDVPHLICYSVKANSNIAVIFAPVFLEISIASPKWSPWA